jgi:hypothetical protein
MIESDFFEKCVRERKETADRADIEAARPRLSAVTAGPAPVAWHVNHHGSSQIYTSLHGLNLDGCVISPLFAAPAAPAQPLTDAQILDILVRIDVNTRRLPQGFKQFARGIEAAHGIKTTIPSTGTS